MVAYLQPTQCVCVYVLDRPDRRTVCTALINMIYPRCAPPGLTQVRTTVLLHHSDADEMPVVGTYPAPRFD
jgi:hypothetical protein